MICLDDSKTDTLKTIKLTREGKKPPLELKYVQNPEDGEILREDARDTILGILRKGIPDTSTSEEIDEDTGQKLDITRHLSRHALSIVELARLSSDPDYSKKPITKSQVIHHLPILIDHGYVIKYGTVTTGKRTTDYYRRTSNLFVFANLPRANDTEFREAYKHDISRMRDVYNLKFDKAIEKELVDLFIKSSKLMRVGRERIIRNARSDIAKFSDVELYSRLYMIYSFKSEEWIEIYKRIREIIFPEEK